MENNQPDYQKGHQRERTILIADDQEVTRAGLSYALQNKGQNIRIIAEAGNGEQAIAQASEIRPDVILMDILMPVINGIDATRAIKTKLPDTKIIILTSYSHEDEVCASLASGADAYCMKDIRIDTLLNVIDMVAEGGTWLDPAIAQIVLNGLSRRDEKVSTEKNAPRAYNTSLTGRETDVLQLIVAGRSNKEIAAVLELSTHTVKTHVCNIIQKLAVDDRTQAAVKALQTGLVGG